MKSSDIAMIVLVAGCSIGISFLVMNSLLGSPSEKKETVKTMAPISADYAEPSKEIFNKQAINPTVQSSIGENGGQHN